MAAVRLPATAGPLGGGGVARALVIRRVAVAPVAVVVGRWWHRRGRRGGRGRDTGVGWLVGGQRRAAERAGGGRDEICWIFMAGSPVAWPRVHPKRRITPSEARRPRVLAFAGALAGAATKRAAAAGAAAAVRKGSRARSRPPALVHDVDPRSDRTSAWMMLALSALSIAEPSSTTWSPALWDGSGTP